MNKWKIISSVILCVLIFISSVSLETSALNYWGVFNEAENSLMDGNYSSAIDKYILVLPHFIKLKDDTNTALIYGRIAKAHSALSNYDKAVEFWEKESIVWTSLNREQDAIIAARKAEYIKSEIKIFTEVDSKTISNKYYTGAKYEPILGAYIGAYAERDPAVHDSSSTSKSYIDQFHILTEKKHAAYLLYLTYGLPFSHYQSHYTKAKESGVAIQLALQPMKGLDEVKDNAYLRQFAKDAANSGIPIFLRFANEMNESSAPWYAKPNEYIEKFRLVANIFHSEAPNVVMVWAPNDFPPQTIEDYYPGDQYVDWVGISTYKIHRPELDPLEKNVDRESYVEKLELIHQLYGNRKPIFISEGAVSYTNITTAADVTPWATQQIENFFTYLPMLYPSVKAYFWFGTDDIRVNSGITRSFTLSKNQQILDSYRSAIRQPFYLSNIGDYAPTFYANIQEFGLAPRKQILHSYIKSVDPDISYVVYKIDNNIIGKATAIPWTISYNFNEFVGKNIDITVEAYSKAGKILTTKNIPITIGNANVSVKGNFIDFDSQPVIIEGRTFIPVRQIAEATDAKVEWNNTTQSFTISKDNNKVIMTIGSKAAIKNGTPLVLETAPFVFNGRSYLPLRFIGEEIVGLNVGWDKVTNTASFD